ncbi:MAG: hypothetical protein WCS30_09730, partial [Selenomonadaceae bacterium]
FGKYIIMNIFFRPVLQAFQANVRENHDTMLFPKKLKKNITMSRGTAVYSAKGIFLYSPWLCQSCPPLHGERAFFASRKPCIYTNRK